MGALLAAALVNIFASPDALALYKQGHPIKAAQVVNPKLIAYWIGAVVALVVLADAAPVVAGWIAALILVGTVLTKGAAAFGGSKQ